MAQRGKQQFHYGIAWWRKLRQHKLLAEPLCEICLKAGKYTPAVEVDHIVPIEKGGAADDWANLQSLCHACHAKKTADDYGGKARWGCDENGNPLSPNSHWNGG